MKVIISPAKTMNFKPVQKEEQTTVPLFVQEASELAQMMKQYTAEELIEVLKVSAPLAAKSYAQYQQFDRPDNPRKSALFTFNGLVFSGLDAETMLKPTLRYAQDHLRILSGLYGMLRPFDLIQPYRLDVAQKVMTPEGGTLYRFWDERVTAELKREGTGSALINLASEEYAKMILVDELPEGTRFITPVFKELRDGKFKVITTMTKTSRGKMARYIVENRIADPELLKAYTEEGYVFYPDLSTDSEWVFVR